MTLPKEKKRRTFESKREKTQPIKFFRVEPELKVGHGGT